MKLENKQLNERYKKLKQSDRMEYLAINSIYENRDNRFSIILFILMGIKMFIVSGLLFILITIISAMGIGAPPISQIMSISLGEGLGILLFSLLCVGVELITIVASYFTFKTRDKLLDEFLLERKV